MANKVGSNSKSSVRLLPNSVEQSLQFIVNFLFKITKDFYLDWTSTRIICTWHESLNVKKFFLKAEFTRLLNGSFMAEQTFHLLISELWKIMENGKNLAKIMGNNEKNACPVVSILKILLFPVYFSWGKQETNSRTNNIFFFLHVCRSRRGQGI